MTGSDSQRQFFSLIREFASEKSQGERRIANQKKQIEELRSEQEAASAELEEAKTDKETTVQELKGYEVELSINEASIQALESRNALTNNEISKLGSELEVLKSEENFLRDGFIVKMLDLNAQIRESQEALASIFNSENFCEESSNARCVIEDKIAQIILQTNMEERQCKAEQVIHDQVQQELIELEKKASLLESIMKESMELQNLSNQMLELEENCASLGDELQKRLLCPRCHQDNSEKLSEILQMSAGS